MNKYTIPFHYIIRGKRDVYAKNLDDAISNFVNIDSSDLLDGIDIFGGEIEIDEYQLDYNDPDGDYTGVKY